MKTIRDLIKAIRDDDLIEILMCIDGGVNPDDAIEDGTPAIIWAVNEGRSEACVAILLVTANANPNICDKSSGRTALDYAIEQGKSFIEKMLIKKGAKTSQQMRDEVAARVEDVRVSFGAGASAAATGLRQRRRHVPAAAMDASSDGPSIGAGR